ncbi:Uncharacterized protein T310_7537 [Rasamsonia emersonii CBS 393.64]|uniref:Rho GTPase activator (Rgd1) n=1 Tax=Rasamsonia emersonii (strain ATCC 16479 / CBS 393.64 / IMI 116815) TaxID=1408163 RepID=A0A0F4YK45_RASE3|nr:Uncharacterized protein T310_7537 [Rasamsonia emersonii CBS 393.64]KKA18500.1 Uncharacterized protein T310_7537 [Rasamsonia emersonii CBS 393.64]
MAEVASSDAQLPPALPSQDDSASPAGVRPQSSSGQNTGPETAAADPDKERIDRVLQSEDFATFLKKRAALEEEHAQGLKKLARLSQETTHRSDHRQGTYSRAQDEVNRIQERMADHGLQFAVSLQQMSEDLQELASNIERGRKQWKQTGLNAEKKVQDAESQVEKAKAKYDSLAEQYDRVRTGDKQSGKFGLKGHKSAAQHEEDLHRKVQNADSDYQAKVQAAQTARQELVSTHRPQTVHHLQRLIYECDSGLTLQLQKFAAFNEKLLLGQGLCVSPLNSGSKSMREVIHQIDSEKDFNDYILSFAGNPGAVAAPEVQYTPHPTLAPASAPSAPPSQPNTQNKRQSLALHAAMPSQQSLGPTSPPQTSPQAGQGSTLPPSFSPQPSSEGYQAYHPPYPTDPTPPPLQQPVSSGPPMGRSPVLQPTNGYQPNLPPLNPVFGVSLEELYRRDGSAVPMIVYQCIQAVELFGLDVEGIYRLSGSANHINHMKALFDNDSSQVDFTNPESFYHDVNSVAGLLKQFFRELPDPLFTRQYYQDFINAARIDNDVQRRDTLHAIINNLPDPNYATLCALVLHLNKVQEHYPQNRMNAGNLAICFGPTLMGANSGGNIADAGWQARVIETVLLNTFQIFDDD